MRQGQTRRRDNEDAKHQKQQEKQLSEWSHNTTRKHGGSTKRLAYKHTIPQEYKVTILNNIPVEVVRLCWLYGVVIVVVVVVMVSVVHRCSLLLALWFIVVHCCWLCGSSLSVVVVCVVILVTCECCLWS